MVVIGLQVLRVIGVRGLKDEVSRVTLPSIDVLAS